MCFLDELNTFSFSEMVFGFLTILLCGIFLIRFIKPMEHGQNNYIRRASPYLWSFLFLIILMVPILKRLHRKMEPEREDIYGTYCIDTTKFPGKQAKWQYEHI